MMLVVQNELRTVMEGIMNKIIKELSVILLPRVTDERSRTARDKQMWLLLGSFGNGMLASSQELCVSREGKTTTETSGYVTLTPFHFNTFTLSGCRRAVSRIW